MMTSQGVIQQRIFIYCFGFHIISSFLVGSTSLVVPDLASNIKAAQSRESVKESSHPTKEVVKPSVIRNRRSSLLSDNEHLYGSNEDLNSAFLYNDQIMQNLLSSTSSKPLSYAHSNFFLNYLKPRTTRYNAWDDHSLMHFGKRSLENDIDPEKALVKRSTDFWSPNDVLHFGKQSENEIKNYEFPQNTFDAEIDNLDSDANDKTKDAHIANANFEKDDSQKENIKKSADPWHSMMSFGKKSQNPWDHNTLHFGKRDEPWHNMMSFGKKSDPWHSMMSFGKKSENSRDQYFDKKDEPWHNMMSFGKRFQNLWDHNTLHFGKRGEWDHNTLHFGKRDPWDHNTLHFGKRDPWDHNTLHFGKRDDPWHNMMSFGKKDDPWHNMMSFGKKSENSEMTDLEKREDPWHNMMSFGKKSDGLLNNNITMFDKRDEPWHSMMSFGKREDPWHSMMSFGKRDEPWHSMMSFGKREEPWHSMMSFGKREEPWHSMMSFGKREEPWHSMMSFGKREEPWHSMMSFGKREEPWHSMMSFGKREEPWHSMMSFGKKSGNPWDHNTLHFGKRDEPWHNMMSFGKKSGNPWDHNTLHFGKKDEPWHSMMSFGKKSDPLAEEINLLLGKDDYPLNNFMSYEKKQDGSIDNLSEDFSSNYDPWHENDGMMFYKKSNPWDHNTLHFGKKSNDTWVSTSPSEKEHSKSIKKRSAEMWNDHHTMHFGKKFDPWDSHNTMHFGKKSDFFENPDEKDLESKGKYDDINKIEAIDKKFDWDSHNTMHFGKRDPEDYKNAFLFNKRDPWDYHNTMHFGKRDPWDYHNTMHFGKRDSWDYHNTMHFGKRNPWEYHNTMHFGKRSNPNLKDGNLPETDKKIDEKEDNISHTENTKEISDNGSTEKQSIIKKRSSNDIKSNEKSKNEKIIIKSPNQALDNPEFLSQSKHLKQPSEIKDKGNNIEAGINVNSGKNDHDNTHQKINKKSHVQKRSVNTNPFMKNSNDDSDENIDLVDQYSKEGIADSVLHFGKRSVETPEDYDEQQYNEEKDKRFDDFWNDHNTLHFGKKSDFWDNHNTLHFGKKYYPTEVYPVVSNTKRDPWEHLNTLHFGKKFDPWDGHDKMHFGKRTDSWDHNVMHFGKRTDGWDHNVMHFGKRTDGWDHNVMHFGKRTELTPDELDILSNLGSENFKNYIQSLNAEHEDGEKNNDFLENLVILKSIINSHLKDNNIPFEERVILLKHYLKPVLKAIIEAEGPNFNPFSEQNDNGNERVKNYRNSPEDVSIESIIIPSKALNGIKYDEAILNNGNDDSSYGEYGDNSRKASSLEDSAKSKRKYLGKSELKRYFVPFQGPKSIVYPHAWFASQIRRSSLPRTTDYARHMEMRMAEKKEDPFNSYMHFGRR